MDFHIPSYTLTCALGTGVGALREKISARCSGLRPNDFPHSGLDTWIGRVEEADQFDWTAESLAWISRENALSIIALRHDGFLDELMKLAERLGNDRIGVIIGSSTCNIERTEHGYRELTDQKVLHTDFFWQQEVHNPHGPAAFVARWTGLSGPTMTISTACSSSAKVFASATRWLAAGIVDAVLVGGSDSLALSVLHGFHSLQLLSASPCRPFDVQRAGINVGEAAGFALLCHPEDAPSARVKLSGYGESSDAWHMSHPHPEGLGVLQAVRAALKSSGLGPEQIDYINLHGTASQLNDSIEANALTHLFPTSVLASSTKGWTGHALGSAGIVEAIITMDTTQTELVPGTLNLEILDPEITFPILVENQRQPVTHAMTNSFGFGGNNCSLVFSKVSA